MSQLHLLKVVEYFKSDVILGGYPWELMFAHSLRAVASWRRSVEDDYTLKEKPKWPYSFFWSFLCHGFGGSFLRDMLIVKPHSIFTNSDLAGTWALAFFLMYHSPHDILYKTAIRPRAPLSLLLTAYEAVDSSGTIVGSYEKGREIFPNSTYAGVVAALIAANGGAFFRFLERKYGRQRESETSELYKPTQTLRIAFIYIVVYGQLRISYGVEKARLFVISFHVLWNLAKEILQMPLDFTVILSYLL